MGGRIPACGIRDPIGLICDEQWIWFQDLFRAHRHSPPGALIRSVGAIFGCIRSAESGFFGVRHP